MAGLEWTPEAALKRARTLITTHRKAAHSGELFKADKARDDALKELAEVVDWLERGGELPAELDRWA